MAEDVMAGYRIRRYEPELRSRLLALQTHMWNPDPSLNSAYFDWKYHQNPFLKEPLIYLALHDAEVVGMRGIYGARWRSGRPPRPVAALCTGDLVIAPEHRDRGLFTRIMDAAFTDASRRGLEWLFSLSAGSVTTMGSLATGWRIARSFHVWRWIGPEYRQDPETREPVADVTTFHWLDQAIDRWGWRPGRIRFSRAPRPEAMARLVERLGGDGRIRHVRDEPYLAWRYGNPLALYRFVFWGTQELEGYLVLQRPLSYDKRNVNIVDWEATSYRIRAALLDAAMEVGRFNVMEAWGSSFPEEARALLEQKGFQQVTPESIAQHRPVVLVRPVRGDPRPEDWACDGLPLLNPDSWDLRQVYSDGC